MASQFIAIHYVQSFSICIQASRVIFLRLTVHIIIQYKGGNKAASNLLSVRLPLPRVALQVGSLALYHEVLVVLKQQTTQSHQIMLASNERSDWFTIIIITESILALVQVSRNMWIKIILQFVTFVCIMQAYDTNLHTHMHHCTCTHNAHAQSSMYTYMWWHKHIRMCNCLIVYACSHAHTVTHMHASAQYLQALQCLMQLNLI